MFIKERNFSMKLNLGHIKIPFIDDVTSDKLFKDGRIFGLIAENIVSGFFNLNKIYGCKDHDLENKDGMFIVDITLFPVLNIYYIKDLYKLLFASKSYKSAKALLDELTNEIN